MEFPGISISSVYKHITDPPPPKKKKTRPLLKFWVGHMIFWAYRLKRYIKSKSWRWSPLKGEGGILHILVSVTMRHQPKIVQWPPISFVAEEFRSEYIQASTGHYCTWPGTTRGQPKFSTRSLVTPKKNLKLNSLGVGGGGGIFGSRPLLV